MKKCDSCLETKALDKFRFYQRPGKKAFHSNTCRLCLNAQKRKWVEENFEQDNARNKAYNKANARRIRGMKLKENYWPEATWEQALSNHQRLLDSQDHVCAICHSPGHPTRGLHVDHCHRTNKIRGLLCYNCNNGIGRLKDSVEILEAATDYLKRSA